MSATARKRCHFARITENGYIYVTTIWSLTILINGIKTKKVKIETAAIPKFLGTASTKK